MALFLDPPRPLDNARIANELAALSLTYQEDENGNLTVAFANGLISVVLSGSTPDSKEIVELVGRWRGQGGSQYAERISDVAVEINRQTVGVKALLLTIGAGDNVEVGLAASVAAYVPSGMNDAQMRLMLGNGIHAINQVFATADKHLSELCTWEEA